MSSIDFLPSHHSLCCQSSAMEDCVDHEASTVVLYMLQAAAMQRMTLVTEKGCPQLEV